MASHVAPGYNPEVSLLQGGNAPILPVQGGGGGMEAGASLPSDYNPSNSLLNVGASATIVPVKGGGQEGGDDEKAYKGYVLERYTPDLKSIPLPDLAEPALKISLLNNIRNYRAFVEPNLKKLSSFTSNPVTYVSADMDNPTYSICPTPGGARNISAVFFRRVRRRIITITVEDPIIWIIPDINGDLSKFLQYIELLTDDAGNTKARQTILFTGSFFHKDDVLKNARLYNEFLNVKLRNEHKNLNTIFLVNTVNLDFAISCCALYKYIYSVTDLTRPLAPFFEPDIVIFKKQQLVIRGSELPISETDPNVKVSEMLKKPDERLLYKDVVIVPDTNEEDDLPSDKGDARPQQKYFTVNFMRNKTVKFPPTSEIVCPTGKVCQKFQGGYSLEKLDESKLPGNAIYVIYKNKDKMPLLKEAGAVLSKENLAKVGPSAAKEEEKPKAEPPKAAAVAATPSTPEETKEEEIVLPNIEQFKPTATVTKSLEEKTVSLNALSFQIRDPFGAKGVKDDWTKGKFTQEEANFLNALQIRPSLLNKAFGKKEAPKKLAEFLETIALSNCFQDTTLLSHVECSNSQQFVQEIYFAMLREILETMYDEMGVLKPLNFLDVIQILKNLLKGRGLVPISLEDFTGNFFDPFGRICYDVEKDEYYIDFAQIPDDMDCDFAFYRVLRPDVNSIYKALAKVLKRAKAAADAEEGKEEEDEDEEVEEEEEEEEEVEAPGFRERVAAFRERAAAFRGRVAERARALAARTRAASPDLRGAMGRMGERTAELGARMRAASPDVRGAMGRMGERVRSVSPDVRGAIGRMGERTAELGARMRAVSPDLRGAFRRGSEGAAALASSSVDTLRGAIDSLQRAISVPEDQPQRAKQQLFGKRPPTEGVVQEEEENEGTELRPMSRTGAASSAAASSAAAGAGTSSAAASSAAPPVTQYKFTDFLLQSQPADTFQRIYVEGDGLCFYRSIMKGLQETPTPDTRENYNPSKAEALAFVQQIQRYLMTHKADVKPLVNAGVEDTAEVAFNKIFRQKTGEEEVVEPSAESTQAQIDAMKVGRIPVATRFYKMDYDQFLRRMTLENDLERPYPEIRDAGVGLAAATVADRVLIIYTKEATGPYYLRDYYLKDADKTASFPLSHVIFLESEGENHFHLLKLAEGKVWPKVSTGGGEEEIFDLGDPIVRRYTRRNKSRKQK